MHQDCFSSPLSPLKHVHCPPPASRSSSQGRPSLSRSSWTSSFTSSWRSVRDWRKQQLRYAGVSWCGGEGYSNQNRGRRWMCDVGWSRMEELNLLPLCKNGGKHLHVRVLAQVGQGGGLKVPHNVFTKEYVNIKCVTSVFKLFSSLSLTFFSFM